MTYPDFLLDSLLGILTEEEDRSAGCIEASLLVKEKIINKFAVSIVNFIEYNAQSTFTKYTDNIPVSGKFTLVNVIAKDRFHYLDHYDLGRGSKYTYYNGASCY